MLFWAMLASGQINMPRSMVSRLSPSNHPLNPSEIAPRKFEQIPDGSFALTYIHCWAKRLLRSLQLKFSISLGRFLSRLSHNGLQICYARW
jgi:hypothetical protein